MIKSKKRLSLICLVVSLLLFITVSASDIDEVFVGGMPFGIRFDSGEVTVLKTNSFISEGKTVSPAENAGIMSNDIIKTINGVAISSTEDVVAAIKDSQRPSIDMIIKRGEKELCISLMPQICDTTGAKQLGVMLKDSSAGIGTVTFINEDSLTFAGLGHGICDNQSGEILKIENGYISDVTISSINMGKCGTPGELRGIISSEKCGKLLSNTNVGVYGLYTEKHPELSKKIEVADKKDIKAGKATILCTLDDNKCREYEIEIVEIDHGANSKTKNYVVKVTDDDLLAKTGGIVQGMSGSPIIQNGKLIGAITHVMINDPTTGYGIFIGNMLDEMEKLV